jgi:hypothetical protein
MHHRYNTALFHVHFLISPLPIKLSSFSPPFIIIIPDIFSDYAFYAAFQLMEIVSAFGPLKAYHFEVNKELSEPCAFLEVIQHCVPLYICL